ncbi:MAG: hypothetical protein WD904_12535 [Dehalococcoidia bacterium]
MTINISLLTAGYVIQASDRRMVMLDTRGRLTSSIKDDANKGVIVNAEDGQFAITFAGIGMYNGKFMDQWLAELAATEGVVELPIEVGVEIIAEHATKLFERIRNVPKQHAFSIAGYRNDGKTVAPHLWVVSNTDLGFVPDSSTATKDHFSVQHFVVEKPGRGLAMIIGAHQSIDRAGRRRLDAAIRNRQLDGVETALVEVIRMGASKSEFAQIINGEVLTVSLTQNGLARSTFHPSADPVENYAPWVVWHEANQNFVAGNAKLGLARGIAYQFGPGLFVPGMDGSGARDDGSGEAGLWFRPYEAKFKTDEPNPGNVRIFGVVPISAATAGHKP